MSSGYGGIFGGPAPALAPAGDSGPGSIFGGLAASNSSSSCNLRGGDNALTFQDTQALQDAIGQLQLICGELRAERMALEQQRQEHCQERQAASREMEVFRKEHHAARQDLEAAKAVFTAMREEHLQEKAALQQEREALRNERATLEKVREAATASSVQPPRPPTVQENERQPKRQRIAVAELDQAQQKVNDQALIEAASDGRLSDVQRLLEVGANVDGVDGDGRTAVYWAAVDGHLPVVEYLVKQAGADAKAAETTQGATALHTAAYGGHLPVVEFLVDEAGLDVEVMKSDGKRPLHQAAASGHLEVVQYLVQQARAEINAKTYKGSTPLARAEDNRNTDVVAFLQLHGGRR